MLIHTTMKPWHSGYINEFIPLSLLFYTESSDGRSNQVVPIYDCIGVATLPPPLGTGTPQLAKIFKNIQNIVFSIYDLMGLPLYHQPANLSCQKFESFFKILPDYQSSDSNLRLHWGRHTTTTTWHRHATVFQNFRKYSKYCVCTV